MLPPAVSPALDEPIVLIHEDLPLDFLRHARRTPASLAPRPRRRRALLKPCAVLVHPDIPREYHDLWMHASLDTRPCRARTPQPPAPRAQRTKEFVDGPRRPLDGPHRPPRMLYHPDLPATRAPSTRRPRDRRASSPEHAPPAPGTPTSDGGHDVPALRKTLDRRWLRYDTADPDDVRTRRRSSSCPSSATAPPRRPSPYAFRKRSASV